MATLHTGLVHSDRPLAASDRHAPNPYEMDIIDAPEKDAMITPRLPHPSDFALSPVDHSHDNVCALVA